MIEERLRRSAAAGWLLVSAGVALVLTIQQWRDPDVWWHLAVGRRILAQGIPVSEPFSFLSAPHRWVGQQWGYEVLLATVTDWAGPGAMSLVMGAAAAGAFVVAALATPRGVAVGGAARCGAVVLGVAVAAHLLGVRGQVITVLGTALTLLLLQRWRDGSALAIWLLIPLTVVWANLDVGFIVGPLLAVTVGALCAFLRLAGESGSSGSLRALAAATGAATVGSLLTPAGVHLWPLVAQATDPTLTELIGAWQSPDFHDPLLRLCEAQALLLVALWIACRRADPVDVALAVGSFAAALQAQQNVALFAVVATPQLARYLTQLGALRPSPRLRRVAARVNPLAVPLGVIVLITALAVRLPATDATAATRNEITGSPAGAADWVAHHAAGKHLYSTYEWGGYLAYRFPSRRVVYVYGEPAVFGPTLLQQYLDVHLARGNWRQRLSEESIDVAVIPAASQEWSLLSEGGWSTACYDPSSHGAVMLAPGEGGSLNAGIIPPRAAQVAPPCQGG